MKLELIDQDEAARAAGEGSLDGTTQAAGQHYRDGFYDQDEAARAAVIGWREKRRERERKVRVSIRITVTIKVRVRLEAAVTGMLSVTAPAMVRPVVCCFHSGFDPADQSS